MSQQEAKAGGSSKDDTSGSSSGSEESSDEEIEMNKGATADDDSSSGEDDRIETAKATTAATDAAKRAETAAAKAEEIALQARGTVLDNSRLLKDWQTQNDIKVAQDKANQQSASELARQEAVKQHSKAHKDRKDAEELRKKAASDKKAAQEAVDELTKISADLVEARKSHNSKLSSKIQKLQERVAKEEDIKEDERENAAKNEQESKARAAKADADRRKSLEQTQKSMEKVNQQKLEKFKAMLKQGEEKEKKAWAKEKQAEQNEKRLEAQLQKQALDNKEKLMIAKEEGQKKTSKLESDKAAAAHKAMVDKLKAERDQLEAEKDKTKAEEEKIKADDLKEDAAKKEKASSFKVSIAKEEAAKSQAATQSRLEKEKVEAELEAQRKKNEQKLKDEEKAEDASKAAEKKAFDEKLAAQKANEGKEKSQMSAEQAEKSKKIEADNEKLQQDMQETKVKEEKQKAQKKIHDEQEIKRDELQQKEESAKIKQKAELAEQKAAEEKAKGDLQKSKLDEQKAKDTAKKQADQHKKDEEAAKAKLKADRQKVADDAKAEAANKEKEKIAQDKAVKDEQAKKTEESGKTKAAFEKKQAAIVKAKEEVVKTAAAEAQSKKEKEEGEKKIVEESEKAKKKAEADAKKKEEAEKAAKKAEEDKKAEEKVKKEAEEKKKKIEEQKQKSGMKIELSDKFEEHGQGYEVPMYTMIGPVCVLSGSAYSADIRNKIGTLDKVCRPEGKLAFDQHGHSTTTIKVDVDTDGVIAYSASTTTALSSFVPLNGMLFPVKGTEIQDVPLHQGRWRSFGSGYMDPTFYVDPDTGFCVLQGTVTTSCGNTGCFNYLIGTLPSACRPRDGRLLMSANNGQYSARVDVLTNGQIHFVARAGGSIPYVSLSGMSFFTESQSQPLDLVGGWRDYNHGYRKPSYQILKNKLCVLSGLATGGYSGFGIVAKLPKACHPHRRLIFSISNHQYTKRVDVLPNGDVLYVDGTAAHSLITFDNIRIVIGGDKIPYAKETLSAADNINLEVNVTALPLLKPWSATGNGYRAPQVQRTGVLCLLSGVARSNDIRASVTKVPSFCAPAGKRRIYDQHTTSTATTRMDLLADGTVRYSGGSHAGSFLPLDGIIYPVKGTRLSSLYLVNPIVNYGGEYEGAHFLKQGDLCVLGGLVKHSGNSAIGHRTLAVLPPGCRPVDGYLIFMTNHHQYSQRMDITKEGSVRITGGPSAHAWASLSGIAFFTRSPNQIDFATGWRVYHPSHRRPSWRLQNGLCVLSGLAYGYGHVNHMGTLPRECRPAERVIMKSSYHSYATRIDVLPDGRIMWVDCKRRNGWVSLDGVYFHADAGEPKIAPEYDVVKSVNKTLNLATQVTAYGKGYEAPAATLNGKICFLSGSLTAGAIQRTLATTPDCVPDYRHVFQTFTGRIARLDVTAEGKVTWVGGDPSSTPIHLGGFHYPAKGVVTNPVELGGNWVPYGEPYAPPTYLKQGKLCMLNGLVRTDDNSLNTWHSVIGYLPAECRPTDANGLMFMSNHHEYSHRIDVTSDGRIVWITGTRRHSWLSLSGIAFMTESESKPLSLTPYARTNNNIGGHWRIPSFQKQGNLCVLSGYLYTSKADFASLPVECRPAGTQFFTAGCSSQPCRIQITAAGRVFRDAGYGSGHINLDGISFLVPSFHAPLKPHTPDGYKSTEGVALQLTNGFAPYHVKGDTFRNPIYTVVGKLCLLSGIAKAADIRATMATLPKNCRPSGRSVFNTGTSGSNSHVSSSGVSSIRFDVRRNGDIGFVSGYGRGGYISLDGMVFPTTEAEEDAIPIPLTARYVNYGDPYAKASYVKQGNLCVLQGMIRTKDWVVIQGNHMATLPTECRPVDGQLIFNINHGRYSHRLDIATNGRIYDYAGTRDEPWISLNGISFYTKQNEFPLPLWSGFGNYGGGYRYGTYKKEGQICSLAGLLRGSSQKTLALVPPACRPKERLAFTVNNNEVQIRLDLHSDGRLIWAEGSIRHNWVSISGITYVVPKELSVQKRAVYKAVGFKEAKVTALDLGNNFENYGRGYQEATVNVLGQFCTIEGLLKIKSPYDTNIKGTFTDALPTTCRPSVTLNMGLHTETSDSSTQYPRAMRVTISPSGSIKFAEGYINNQQSHLSLSGMIFPVNGTDQTDLELMDWHNYGHHQGKAKWVKQGDVCVLTGAITFKNEGSNSAHGNMFRIPSECKTVGRHCYNINSGSLSNRIDFISGTYAHWITGEHGNSIANAVKSFITLDGQYLIPDNKGTGLSFSSGWGNYGHSYAAGRYFAQGNMCYMYGLVNGGSQTRIAQTGADCRPNKRVVLFGDHHYWTWRIDVLPDGSIYRVNSRRNWSHISLQGVAFRRVVS